MSRVKQLQIMKNLRARNCYRMYRSGGRKVPWSHIDNQRPCRRSLKNTLIMNGCCLKSANLWHVFATLAACHVGDHIRRRDPQKECLFRGQSCCVLNENDSLQCWIVCQPELMQTDTSQREGGLLVTWRGWPFIGKNKQRGQQNNGGVNRERLLERWWAGF